jgi:hypothetical protein
LPRRFSFGSPVPRGCPVGAGDLGAGGLLPPTEPFLGGGGFGVCLGGDCFGLLGSWTTAADSGRAAGVLGDA